MGSVYNILRRVKRDRGQRQQVWSAPYQSGQPMIQHPPIPTQPTPAQMAPQQPQPFVAPPMQAPQQPQPFVAPPTQAPQQAFTVPPAPVPMQPRPQQVPVAPQPPAPVAPTVPQAVRVDELTVPKMPQSAPTHTGSPSVAVPLAPQSPANLPQPPAAVVEPIVAPPQPVLPVVPAPPMQEAAPPVAPAPSAPTAELPIVPPPPAIKAQAVDAPAPTLTNTAIRIEPRELPTPPGAPPTSDPTGEQIVIPAPQGGVGHYVPQVVVHHDRGSVITEQYRAIRLQILARCRNRKLQTHVITSSAPNEGKTLTSINLAMAFAELQNKRTLLIEGDLRRPSFQQVIGQQLSPGLLHLLREQTDDVEQAIHDTPYENVKFMPAGDHGTTSSTELLSTHRFPQILETLKGQFDHILIDTPPVISVTDACIFGALADEVILVVRLGETPVEVVDRTKRLLRASNCEVAGVVLTHMKHHIPKYLYRYV